MSTAGHFKWLAAALIMAVVMGCAESLQEQPPAQSGGSGATAPVVEQQDLPKIAVYVTGDVPNNEKDALGTRILASLVNSGRYMAIERSNTFLAEIDKEHIKQRSGAIDDGQISELGKQFGVKFVCIANITPVLGAFQISARIIDVETAAIVFIGESYSALKNVIDLVSVSDQVVKNMFGGQTAPKPESKPEPPKPHTVAAARPTVAPSRDTTYHSGKLYTKPEEPKPYTRNGDIDIVFVQGGMLKNVRIKDFYICKYEITQKQWVQVMGTNPSKFKGDDLPVENVSWNDVQKFITRLNSVTGNNYRLPSQEEWEYAARGGSKSNGYKYSGSNNIDEVAWYKRNSKEKTHVVGTKQPNELGIYDMSGNVFEWTNGGDPYRVYRGGSWLYFARDCRVSFRNYIGPGFRYNYLGFRLAVSP